MPPSMASLVSTLTYLPGVHDAQAMPFQFIDSNILKGLKTCLTNHTQPVSHHIMPLVINSLGGGHKDTYRHTNKNNFKKPELTFKVKGRARLV